MSRVWQEFYCGECKGYIRVKLNIELNHEVEVVCPKCGHRHRRVIRDGQIFENGRFTNEPKEEICPPMSAYQKEPWTKKMRTAHEKNDYGARRAAEVITADDVPKESSEEGSVFGFLKQSWFERFGGQL